MALPLPENKHVFDFDMVGDTTGKEYKGQFTSVCVLNMLQKQLLGIEKTKLQADFTNPDPELKGIATILSNLRIRLMDAPEWWNQSDGGYDLQDENVIVALYSSVLEGENKWRSTVKKQAEKKSTENTQQSEKSDTSSNQQT